MELPITHIFIIPSWYPSKNEPYTGIFFKEQAVELAKLDDIKTCICHWGQNDYKYLISPKYFPYFLFNIFKKSKLTKFQLTKSCWEYGFSTYTWTRKFDNGNIKSIIYSVSKAFDAYTQDFEKPSLIIAHVAFPAGFIAYHLSIKYQIPYVIVEHMSPFPFSFFLNKNLPNHFISQPLQSSKENIAVSHSLQTKMSEFGFSSSVLPNFIDDQFFIPTKKARKWNQWICIARMETQKNIPFLLESLKRVLDDFPETILLIIGEGSLRKKIESLISSLQLQNNVFLLGQKSRIEIRDILQESKGMIMTSLHENQPVVVLESLACGTPVVSTPFGDVLEWIPKKIGEVSIDFSLESFTASWISAIGKEYDQHEIRSYYEARYSSKITLAKWQEKITLWTK